jgi:hypothetical protein
MMTCRISTAVLGLNDKKGTDILRLRGRAFHEERTALYAEEKLSAMCQDQDKNPRYTNVFGVERNCAWESRSTSNDSKHNEKILSDKKSLKVFMWCMIWFQLLQEHTTC